MTLTIFFSLFHILTLILVCTYGFYLISVKKAPIQIVFFVFAVVGDLLSALYWMTYDILRPDMRMPFAANELSEWAMFLLLGASLSVTQQSEKRKNHGVIVLGTLFSAANVALWIGWSGEWFQDIVTGIVYCYFLCCVLIRFKESTFISDKKLAFIAGYAFVLIIAQAMTFLTPKNISGNIDKACYVIMYGGMLILFILLFWFLRKKASPSDLVTLAYGIMAWTITSMYMSSDPIYYVGLGIMIVAFPVMLFMLKKEAALQ